ncbi:hypothetical protein NL108_014360, partial [Boleophthalmus pectinirostris]
MRSWWSSSFLVAALILECCAVSAAVPISKAEDGSLEQDALASLLNDDMSETNLSEVEVS